MSFSHRGCKMRYLNPPKLLQTKTFSFPCIHWHSTLRPDWIGTISYLNPGQTDEQKQTWSTHETVVHFKWIYTQFDASFHRLASVWPPNPSRSKLHVSDVQVEFVMNTFWPCGTNYARSLELVFFATCMGTRMVLASPFGHPMKVSAQV